MVFEVASKVVEKEVPKADWMEAAKVDFEEVLRVVTKVASKVEL